MHLARTKLDARKPTVLVGLSGGRPILAVHVAGSIHSG